MTDPVAEAAAKIAAQQAEPSLLEKAMGTIHELEAKVEHLIHPEIETKTYFDGTVATGVAPLPDLSPAQQDALESVPNVTPGSPAIEGSATLSEPSGQSTQTSSSTKPSESLPIETPVLASSSNSTESSASIPTSSEESESPNAPAASTTGIENESTPSVGSGLTGEVSAGIQGVLSTASAEPAKLASAATSAIKAGVANIKRHLSIRGFEQSAVADIHAELDSIEKWL